MQQKPDNAEGVKMPDGAVLSVLGPDGWTVINGERIGQISPASAEDRDMEMRAKQDSFE